MSNLEKLQADLANLKAMRGSGVLQSRSGDSSVTFRSMPELLQAISKIEREIERELSSRRRSPRYVTQRTKAF